MPSRLQDELGGGLELKKETILKKLRQEQNKKRMIAQTVLNDASIKEAAEKKNMRFIDADKKTRNQVIISASAMNLRSTAEDGEIEVREEVTNKFRHLTSILKAEELERFKQVDSQKGSVRKNEAILKRLRQDQNEKRMIAQTLLSDVNKYIKEALRKRTWWDSTRHSPC
uniref:Uncharacterized protein n=1 Tax=Timema genevievae TaxID=629358 RepID=A0A7R9K1I9_TIMGE|nr:unnamed protein product [Timema genevievae]